MSDRRALVECAVLSLQDSCVYYPFCKWCFSRIDAEQQNTTRCRCSKCGYSYVREEVDYRYRLSLRVARETSIFGVTVFGTCLNPFFGIPAIGLKRLVDSSDGPLGASTRSKLLLKAVEDCFIGRHFIFGIKLPEEGKGGLWSGGSVENGSCGKDTSQFIASQMILPKVTELTGCTVASYYRVLLQKVEEYELISTDTSKTSRPPAPNLILTLQQSPSSSFNNTTFSALSLLSLPRSQYQDCTLTPTPPWEQSLGLITSSAEQEEGFGSQGSGKENNNVEYQMLRGCLENHKPNKDTPLSPILAYNGYPYSSIKKPVVNSPFPSVQKENLPLISNLTEYSCTQLTQTFLSSSLAWDELPFSESLTEFLCGKDKDFDNSTKTETQVHLKNQTETTGSHNKLIFNDELNLKKLSTKPNLVCQSTAQITARQSSLIPNVTNIPASNNGVDRNQFSDSVRMNSPGYIERSKARSICSHDCKQDDEEAISSFDDEEHLGDDYNCSADLFSYSLVNDNTSVNTETVSLVSEDCTANPMKRLYSQSKKKLSAPNATPQRHMLTCNACNNTDSLISPTTQDLYFVPPSQSTPNVASNSCLKFTLTLGEIGSQLDNRRFCNLHRDVPKSSFGKKAVKISPALCKANTDNAYHLCQLARESPKKNLVWGKTCARRSQSFTPKRSFFKSKNRLHSLPLRQCLRVPSGALNHVPIKRITHMCDSSVEVCNYEDNELPPTPGVKMLRRQWTDDSSNSLNSTCNGQQGGGDMCKRTLLPLVVTSLQDSVGKTGNCESEFVGEQCLVGSNIVVPNEIQAFDWSRDLFSDSIC